MVAKTTFSSQLILVNANAAQLPASPASIGTTMSANASATIPASPANQISIGIRKNVLANVRMMTLRAILILSILIMIVAHANVCQLLMMCQHPSPHLQQALPITGVPLQTPKAIVTGDVPLQLTAHQVNTSMTLNANVCAHHKPVLTCRSGRIASATAAQ